MTKLSAEAIVAGPRERDRQAAIINELMNRLVQEVCISYGTPVFAFDHADLTEIGEVPKKFYVRFGIVGWRAAFLQIDGLDPMRTWRWRSSEEDRWSFPDTSLFALWEAKDDIAEMVASHFPETRERLEMWQSYGQPQ